jgi:hypothetical protein
LKGFGRGGYVATSAGDVNFMPIESRISGAILAVDRRIRGMLGCEVNFICGGKQAMTERKTYRVR